MTGETKMETKWLYNGCDCQIANRELALLGPAPGAYNYVFHFVQLERPMFWEANCPKTTFTVGAEMKMTQAEARRYAIRVVNEDGGQ
jgi:hypothetical protein